MLKTAESRERWLFWLVALLVLGAGLGLRDPWPADEPRFALVAKQMVDSHQWLFPMRGNELYADKPPLFMWLQAIALTVVGNLRVAFLLPSLLASLGTLALLRDLGARLYDRRAGAYAAWALLFTFAFTFQARRAQIDPLLVFWVTLSVYGLVRHLVRGPDLRMWYLGWFAAGLGVITKGVGVIALLVLIPAAVLHARGWASIGAQGWRRPATWLGPVLLVLPIAVWLGPMLWAVEHSTDPALHDYADNILLRQTAKRYVDPSHHIQPVWYFPVVILTQWLPAWLALPWVWSGWRDAWRARDGRLALLLTWVALVVVFFSLSAGKREVYILPALPMFCLALGAWLPAAIEQPNARRLAFGLATALTLLLGIAGAMVVFGHPGFEQRLDEARGMVGGADALGRMMLAIAAWGAAMVFAFGVRRGVAALLGTLTGLWLLVGLAAQPLLNDASSARGLMQRAAHIVGPTDEFALVAWKEQNLLMADRPARTFGFVRDPALQLRDALVWQREAPSRRWILLEDDALASCIDRARATFVGHSNRREWWLVPSDAAARCAAKPVVSPAAAVPEAGGT
ncbi:ArnT family glycosyltransferase [Cognatilysobacter terrigena]|uniref:ArnT family glycosyltransferase n=1 Tax=Cognatilysobacter terrigena TaxID=2488749 RepID=UPI00141516DB|nr:glycosyltransferase family 39 protein [Lysobacter terrigena]